MLARTRSAAAAWSKSGRVSSSLSSPKSSLAVAMRGNHSVAHQQQHQWTTTKSMRMMIPMASSNSLSMHTDRCSAAGSNNNSSNYYSTRRAIERKSGRKGPIPSLYDASRETENCGVGLIASLKSVPSRDIVEKADEMLVRMAHRGGCGCDPASGDGSGKW